MLRVLIAALLVLAPCAASAQVVSERPEKVAIVVYPGGDPRSPGARLQDGLVMVSELRTVDLPAGPVTVRFRDVAEGIVPQTVAVQGLPSPVKEQNFDYQLLSPGSLIAASDGRSVRIVRTDPASGRVTDERARVVSSQTGAVLDFGGGRIEALRCSGLPERIVFDDLPPGFSDKPTLSVDLVSPAAGRATLIVSYLATGVSWSADYVARLNPDGRTLDLSSWITIGNRSATGFSDAPVQVLAGRLERRPGETRPVIVPRRYFNPACWPLDSGRYGGAYLDAPPPAPPPMPAPPPVALASARMTADAAGAAEVTPEDLGDYKIYSLPEPVTVAPYQIKQVRMFERTGVPYRLVRRIEIDGVSLSRRRAEDRNDVAAAETVAELENRRSRRLGLPLPEGIVRVFGKGGAGRDMFLGEDRLRDTAVDLPFELGLGASPQVQASVRVLEAASDSEGRLRRARVEVVLTNALAEPVEAQVRETGAAGRLRVTMQSAPHELKYGAPQWTLRLPANGARTLTYTVELRD